MSKPTISVLELLREIMNPADGPRIESTVLALQREVDGRTDERALQRAHSESEKARAHEKIGQEVVTGGSKGHLACYGTPGEKRARWDAYQAHVDAQHMLHSSWSYAALTKDASTRLGVSQKTIYRHVHKP
jgi:hypothetical protein